MVAGRSDGLDEACRSLGHRAIQLPDRNPDHRIPVCCNAPLHQAIGRDRIFWKGVERDSLTAARASSVNEATSQSKEVNAIDGENPFARVELPKKGYHKLQTATYHLFFAILIMRIISIAT